MVADSESDVDTEHDTGADVGHDLEEDERVTAPMGAYGSREVALGVLVMLVGVAVAFGIPLVALGI